LTCYLGLAGLADGLIAVPHECRPGGALDYLCSRVSTELSKGTPDRSGVRVHARWLRRIATHSGSSPRGTGHLRSEFVLPARKYSAASFPPLPAADQVHSGSLCSPCKSYQQDGRLPVRRQGSQRSARRSPHAHVRSNQALTCWLPRLQQACQPSYSCGCVRGFKLRTFRARRHQPADAETLGGYNGPP